MERDGFKVRVDVERLGHTETATGLYTPDHTPEQLADHAKQLIALAAEGFAPVRIPEVGETVRYLGEDREVYAVDGLRVLVDWTERGEKMARWIPAGLLAPDWVALNERAKGAE